jgi:hypothetical protein
MAFTAKADYAGPKDAQGVPMLDYHGAIGPQYNPIAIAQYALGNYNLFYSTGEPRRKTEFLKTADWLVENLEENKAGLRVWHHHFDWEYRTPLKAPWYSGLAQGQGISALVRAHQITHDNRYLEAARAAFESLLKTVDQGGVIFIDASGHKWIEEYLVDPPTHILNGFLWASWGVYDFWLASGDPQARVLFEDCAKTIAANLGAYDLGFWSLYEQSGTRLPMLASPFYHRLHIVQLEVMNRLTGMSVFSEYATRWAAYAEAWPKRTRALIYKSAFKLLYY